jgi:hypothetical protein
MEPKTLYDVATVPKVDRKRLNSSKDPSEKPRPDLRRAGLFLSRLHDPALEKDFAQHTPLPAKVAGELGVRLGLYLGPGVTGGANLRPREWAPKGKNISRLTPPKANSGISFYLALTL